MTLSSHQRPHRRVNTTSTTFWRRPLTSAERDLVSLAAAVTLISQEET